MSSRIRIFVVDDEQDLTDLLHYQLGKEGFKVKFSNNPYEALGNARDFNPDLIILDVMMPDLNGFQLLRMIRADNLLQKTPVIMLTAKTDVEHRIKGLEQGADDYLGKPFDSQELVLRIRSILKRTAEQMDDDKDELCLETFSWMRKIIVFQLPETKWISRSRSLSFYIIFLNGGDGSRLVIISFWASGSLMQMLRPEQLMYISEGFVRKFRMQELKLKLFEESVIG